MSATTDKDDGSIFTGKAPGFLSQWDAETFEKAGLTPFDKLKARYGDNYTMLVTEAENLRQQLDTDQWQIIVTKCEMGGMIKLAKSMTAHGGKGAVPRDFKLHPDTALTYERGYDTMPWAYEEIRKRAAAALAEGEDYIYSLKDIIKIGDNNAIAAGAKRVRPKYTGTGKVFIFDSEKKAGTYEDLPNPFPGQKRVRADVHPKPSYWELIEGYAVGPAKLWKEVDPETPNGIKPYYTLRLTTASKEGGGEAETVPFRERVMIALIDRKDVVLELKPTVDLLSLCDFDVREPTAVQVIDIDPTTAKVERHTTLDNDFTEEPAEAFTPLSGLFAGLTLVQTEPTDDYRFTLAGQSFAGRSFIVRLDETTALSGAKWLAPLNSPLSAGDVAQHISFDTFDAVNRAKGNEPTADPNAGLEVLDAEKWHDYFGVTGQEGIYQYLHREFQTPSRYAADSAASQAGILMTLHGRPAWHILKLKEIVERQKAAIAAETKAAEEAATKTSAGDATTEQVREPETEQVAEPGIEQVTDPETEQVTEPGNEQVTEPETEQVTEPETEQVTEPETEPVREPETEQVTEPETEQVTEPETEEVMEPVIADRGTPGTIERETAESEIVEPSYAEMGHEERELEDRNLVDDVNGKLDAIERSAIGIITAFEAEGSKLVPSVQQVVNDVIIMRDAASAAHVPLAKLADHIEILKAKVSSDDPLADVKRDIIRLAPHLDLNRIDILACYVETPDGTVRVFDGTAKSDAPTA